jgi:hypothetical protein
MMDKMSERDKLIKPMRKDFKGSNITDYNKLYPFKKLSVCWIIFDEIASIMEKTGNNKKISQQKDRIITMIEEIARIGRALGIFLGVCLQRPSAQMLSPTVKSQTNLKISFSQNNIKSSEIATDDPHIAIGLDERVAVYTCRAKGFDFVKTPYIDDEYVKKYVQPKSKRGHRNLFSDLEKLKKDKRILDANVPIVNNEGTIDVKDTPPVEIPTEKENIVDSGKIQQIIEKTMNNQPKTTKNEEIFVKNDKKNENKSSVFISLPIEFNNVDPDAINKKQESLKENIIQIPNYVPFIDYSKFKNIKIIDQTQLNAKTEKPRKQGENI